MQADESIAISILNDFNPESALIVFGMPPPNKKSVATAQLLRSNPVEPAGVEPASKHMPDMLSTCLLRNLISGGGRNRTNLLPPYLLWF